MNKLSLREYVWKCVLGGEVIYAICLFGGYLPFRTEEASRLHRVLFEMIPGFTWGTTSSIVWGAVVVLASSVLFGSYMVWMYNTSLRRA